MQLAAKLMGRQVASHKYEVKAPSTPTMQTDEPSDEVVFRWRRLSMMIGLVDVHASSGSILNHLETMRERIAEQARRAYEKAAGAGAKVTKTATKAPSTKKTANA